LRPVLIPVCFACIRGIDAVISEAVARVIEILTDVSLICKADKEKERSERFTFKREDYRTIISEKLRIVQSTVRRREN
jgi:hypothetical protein